MFPSKSCILLCVLRRSRAVTRQYHHVVRPLTSNYGNRVLGSKHSLLSNNTELSWCLLSRHYAKKKGHAHVQLSADEISPIMDMAKYKADFQKVLDDLKQEYTNNLSLRTSTATFDRLQIKTKDGTFPLNQIASLIQKNPTLLIVNLVQSIQYVPEVMDALRKSGMNLNPQQEGPHTIFISIPKVSREHREELSKSAKLMFNTTKEKFNKLYSLKCREIEKQKKTQKLSSDLFRDVTSLCLDEMRIKVSECETMMKAKQKELLGSDK